MKKLLLIFLTALTLSAFGQAPTITYSDKDKNAPTGDPRKLVRDVDLNEIKEVVNDHAALLDDIGSGTVTSVSGTANRITSSGGFTPVINISSTFEALLAKRAERIDQNNAATSSAQLATVISDETGTGVVVYSTSPTFTRGITTPLIKVTSGSPGAGKVLTSDADGDGTWSTPTVAASGITGVLGIANGGNGTTNGISTEVQAALNLKTTNTNFAIRVIPSGTINGVNTVFTLGEALVEGSDQVFINGLQQIEGVHYGRVTTTFTFMDPPETGDVITINFIRP